MMTMPSKKNIERKVDRFAGKGSLLDKLKKRRKNLEQGDPEAAAKEMKKKEKKKKKEY
jgi:hypothetical protein